jgi:hypothetical protein
MATSVCAQTPVLTHSSCCLLALLPTTCRYRELSGWADIHLHVPLEKLVEGLQVDAAAASQKRRRGPNHTSDSDRQLQEDRFGNRGRLESGSGGGAVPAGGKSFVTGG